MESVRRAWGRYLEPEELASCPDPVVLLEFVGLDGSEERAGQRPELLLDLNCGQALASANGGRTQQPLLLNELHAAYAGCSNIRVAPRFANGPLRSLLRCATPAAYESLLAQLLATDPLLRAALKDSCLSLLEGADSAPATMGGSSPAGAPSHPLLVQHPLLHAPSCTLLPLTLRPVLLRRPAPAHGTHEHAGQRQQRPGQQHQGSPEGGGRTLVAAVVVRYSISDGLGAMHEQLGRCMTALSGLPSAVTLLSYDGRTVIFQNAPSVRYMGMRQGGGGDGGAILMETAATAPASTPLLSERGDVMRAGGGLIHGRGANALYGKDSAMYDSVLRELFVLSPKEQLHDVLQCVASGRPWAGILRVPQMLARPAATAATVAAAQMQSAGYDFGFGSLDSTVQRSSRAPARVLNQERENPASSPERTQSPATATAAAATATTAATTAAAAVAPRSASGSHGRSAARPPSAALLAAASPGQGDGVSRGGLQALSFTASLAAGPVGRGTGGLLQPDAGGGGAGGAASSGSHAIGGGAGGTASSGSHAIGGGAGGTASSGSHAIGGGGGEGTGSSEQWDAGGPYMPVAATGGRGCPVPAEGASIRTVPWPARVTAAAVSAAAGATAVQAAAGAAAAAAGGTGAAMVHGQHSSPQMGEVEEMGAVSRVDSFSVSGISAGFGMGTAGGSVGGVGTVGGSVGGMGTVGGSVGGMGTVGGSVGGMGTVVGSVGGMGTVGGSVGGGGVGGGGVGVGGFSSAGFSGDSCRGRALASQQGAAAPGWVPSAPVVPSARAARNAVTACRSLESGELSAAAAAAIGSGYSFSAGVGGGGSAGGVAGGGGGMTVRAAIELRRTALGMGRAGRGAGGSVGAGQGAGDGPAEDPLSTSTWRMMTDAGRRGDIRRHTSFGLAARAAGGSLQPGHHSVFASGSHAENPVYAMATPFARAATAAMDTGVGIPARSGSAHQQPTARPACRGGGSSGGGSSGGIGGAQLDSDAMAQLRAAFMDVYGGGTGNSPGGGAPPQPHPAAAAAAPTPATSMYASAASSTLWENVNEELQQQQQGDESASLLAVQLSAAHLLPAEAAPVIRAPAAASAFASAAALAVAATVELERDSAGSRPASHAAGPLHGPRSPLVVLEGLGSEGVSTLGTSPQPHRHRPGQQQEHPAGLAGAAPAPARARGQAEPPQKRQQHQQQVARAPRPPPVRTERLTPARSVSMSPLDRAVPSFGRASIDSLASNAARTSQDEQPPGTPPLPGATTASAVDADAAEAAAAMEAAAAEDEEATFHEVLIRLLPAPAEGGGAGAGPGSMLLLTQTDVTARVRAERGIARVLEAEHRLLESIFPRHVLELAAANARQGSERQGGAARYSLTQLPLAQGSTSVATYHPMVTILFSDIIGFTSMCTEIPATSVMTFLNRLYSQLDSLCDVYGVYKVETIGDCYMVAGGLMTRDADGFMTVRGPEAGVDELHAAKAMQREASRVMLPTTGTPVQMRIGLHSGPVTSGIVGSKMPRFCLFGDTVNTASRMESTCPPGAVHVSAATRECLPDEEWESTGGLQVKGKGFMNTFRWQPNCADHVALLAATTSDGRPAFAAAAEFSTKRPGSGSSFGSPAARTRRASAVISLRVMSRSGLGPAPHASGTLDTPPSGSNSRFGGGGGGAGGPSPPSNPPPPDQVWGGGSGGSGGSLGGGGGGGGAAAARGLTRLDSINPAGGVGRGSRDSPLPGGGDHASPFASLASPGSSGSAAARLRPALRRNTTVQTLLPGPVRGASRIAASRGGSAIAGAVGESEALPGPVRGASRVAASRGGSGVAGAVGESEALAAAFSSAAAKPQPEAHPSGATVAAGAVAAGAVAAGAVAAGAVAAGAVAGGAVAAGAVATGAGAAGALAAGAVATGAVAARAVAAEAVAAAGPSHEVGVDRAVAAGTDKVLERQGGG
ncbi:Guanylate cyclase soluble subunit beta-2 [Tetrabaena socialis]|uniref:Guanylate cyclase soluble subunit beta-2 n=1 Tax=Tetrabaena socialis TaxID=47790 RepID=A0A2J7ZQL8_9CHLO|nr:Guanylate cyclase soluble subunit beta-2 [Tetrabaena socialis]|eukprot:PNH02565.1 Guanylate cyclase soluble subunit beta-2 [Tetrabaena socialis]